MKIKNWIACVQDRGKWKEVVEKAKTFNQEVQRLEEEEEDEDLSYVCDRKQGTNRTPYPNRKTRGTNLTTFHKPDVFPSEIRPVTPGMTSLFNFTYIILIRLLAQNNIYKYKYIYSFIYSLVFSPQAGFSRNQNAVRRPVWLWHTASWANSQGQVAIAFPHIYIARF